jgi:Zn-dependent protease with chaperone function
MSMSRQKTPQAKNHEITTVTDKFKRLTHLSLFILCLGASGMGAAVHAQEPVSEPAKETLSSEDVKKAVGTAFNAIGGFFKQVVKAPEQPKETMDYADNATANANAVAKPASGTSRFNIIDITQISSTASTVLDPMCKEPVQPFGITDNAASLLLLAGKMKLQGTLDISQQGGRQATTMRDVIKMAARNLNWLPQDLELKLGEILLKDADILDEHRNKASERAYTKARIVLDDLVRLLPQPLPYSFKILVNKTSHRSASALPGGIILVDRDLVEDDADPDLAYFVVGHEIAHVLQRHQTRAYQARLVDGIDTLDNLSKFITSQREKSPESILGFASALKKLVVEFSENQELQADSCSIRWMSQRLGDPKKLRAKMLSITQQIAPEIQSSQKSTNDRNVIDMLTHLGDGVYERHPNSKKRRDNILSTLNLIISGK